MVNRIVWKPPLANGKTRGVQPGSAGQFKNLISFSDFGYGKQILPGVRELFKQKYGLEVSEVLVDPPAKVAVMAMDKPTFLEALRQKGDFSAASFNDFSILIEPIGPLNNVKIYLLREPANKNAAAQLPEVTVEDLRRQELAKQLAKLGNPADLVLNHIKAIRASGWITPKSPASSKLASLFREIQDLPKRLQSFAATLFDSDKLHVDILADIESLKLTMPKNSRNLDPAKITAHFNEIVKIINAYFERVKSLERKDLLSGFEEK